MAKILKQKQIKIWNVIAWHLWLPSLGKKLKFVNVQDPWRVWYKKKDSERIWQLLRQSWIYIFIPIWNIIIIKIRIRKIRRCRGNQSAPEPSPLPPPSPVCAGAHAAPAAWLGTVTSICPLALVALSLSP